MEMNQVVPNGGLDLSFMDARTLAFNYSYKTLNLVMVGAGGTGGWLAPHLARLARILIDKNDRNVKITFIDPDIVEKANLYRQNFAPSELGMNKAQTLARRYSMALGVEIVAISEAFGHGSFLSTVNSGLVIIIGCVDNVSARRSIAEYIAKHYQSFPFESVFWLDCGNYHNGGQVLLGNTEKLAKLQESFAVASVCRFLPSPALQHPELLQPLTGPAAIVSSYPSDISSNNAGENEAGLSCEGLAMRSTQSLTINQHIAAVAHTYLVKMLSGKLCYFQTYLNLDSMTSKSTYITPQTVAQVLGKKPDFFHTTHA
jgi:PRTRC genetic system ThiF family protein